MEKVILRNCIDYDPQKIESNILDGMDILGIHPEGQTMVKPNLVMPHARHFAGCYTRPEFMDGLLGALRKRGKKLTDLVVGERSGITIPSRYAFAEAGYTKVLRKRGVKPIYFDEVPSVPVSLKHPEALRPLVYVPEPLTRCDFLVNVPKFKIHAWVQVTFALKNYIGLQDDAHRLIDHNFMLSHKIVDLQEIKQAGFIAIDGIEAGEYSEIAPSSFPLKLIVMGTNPVAVDSVCTHIVGLNPEDIEYIRLACERGYGPIDLSKIEILGDVTLSEAQRRAKGIKHGAVRVDDFLNNKSNISIYLGKPPERDYCPAGCPGAILEATQIVEVFQPGMRKEIKPLSFILGAYQGEIHPKSGGKVIALGDCACWSGKIKGNQVDIASIYKPHVTRDPSQARATDALQKSIKIIATVFRQRKQPVTIVRGCPVPILEVTNLYALLGGTVNPSMQHDILPKFIFFVILSKLMKSLNRVTRKGEKTE